jgi:hypothetical protein
VSDFREQLTDMIDELREFVEFHDVDAPSRYRLMDWLERYDALKLESALSRLRAEVAELTGQLEFYERKEREA